MRLTFTSIGIFCLSITASAEVVRFDVSSRTDLLGGKALGLAGAYETMQGKVYLEVDPGLAPNLIITDIDKAPVGGNGRVAFSTDFYFIKPKHLERGNGALLLEVGNRGGKGLLSFFNRAEGSLDPKGAAELGDGFLMEEGFALLWVGWQWDTPEVEGRMRMYPAVATDEGRPIRGLVRSDFVVSERRSDHSLADRNHIAYPVADPDLPENVMTVRDGVEDERRIIPRSQWRFARLSGGEIVDDPRSVHLEGGFEPNRIYEIVYVSENPPLVGLGPAAIRDVVARLKYEGAAELSVGSDELDRALAFGISQSGRFLRTFLYYGFNEDEAHRRVFDGVIAHVAGGGRGSFNHRFAQASRDAHPYLNFFHPTDIFPFTDREQVDFRTGTNDGLLVYQKPEHLPKVFYTNSSYEYWGRAASLIHTSIDGREDAKLMDNVRIYQFAGTQHGPVSFPPQRTLGQQPSNPMDFRWSMRALLVAMDRWTREGTDPPESQYSRIEDGSLVAPQNLSFPGLPGVSVSDRVHKAYRVDYGERFKTDGVVTKEPPEVSGTYPILVPAVDGDGNERAGIRLPEQAVPLATYTGWNLFNEESGPTNTLASMQGSFIPFARTEKERRAKGDPRLSIEARYRDRAQYVGRVAEAAIELVKGGYLLDRDVVPVLELAGEHWDYLTAAPERTQ
ncbi:MAG TPA: alpha/beta hydrolase domain-containing protein [Vicinamibacteria bacterium]|nr:alpha/beta hydrolase domain-containing protein [Vicinamibacteria bacterium]